ncbi:MAG: hypothetical protein AB7E77_04440 [Desulfobulbus sp.]
MALLLPPETGEATFEATFSSYNLSFLQNLFPHLLTFSSTIIFRIFSKNIIFRTTKHAISCLKGSLRIKIKHFQQIKHMAQRLKSKKSSTVPPPFPHNPNNLLIFLK